MTGSEIDSSAAKKAARRLRSLHQGRPIVLVLTDTSARSLGMDILRRVAGVVVVQGALLSTAVIVARELEVPVVAGLGQAIRGICDGQWVRLDGTAGTVEVIASELTQSGSVSCLDIGSRVRAASTCCGSMARKEQNLAKGESDD